MSRYVLLAGLALCSCVPSSGKISNLRSGPWHAWLDSPGGPIPFDLEIHETNGRFSATIRNGREFIDIPEVRQEKNEIVFHLESYASEIRAVPRSDGTVLDGRWRRPWGVNRWTGLDFHAAAGARPRFDGKPSSDRIDGRWLVSFSKRDFRSVGIFKSQSDSTIQGTFLNTTGDYRFLEGSFSGDQLHLSRFDGGAAFLFQATLAAPDSLFGHFWEGDYFEDVWIGRRDPAAELQDTFGIFTISGKLDLAGVGLVDLEGRDRTLADPEFQGKLLLIEVLGTWCQNCQDSSQFLKELYGRYHAQGLSALGIAFEFSEDFGRNAESVRKYRDRHGIPYPLLLAWRNQAKSPSALFPVVKGEFAFPSFLFVSPTGEVRAAATGFTGPAGGEDHLRLKAKFEELVQDFLLNKHME
jgi:glutathione peroxidase-family protein